MEISKKFALVDIDALHIGSRTNVPKPGYQHSSINIRTGGY